MKAIKKIILLGTIITTLSSCFKDIDINEERIHIPPKQTFYVENNIQNYQSFFKFDVSTITDKDTVIQTSFNDDAIWDLAFEASADGFKVFPNYCLNALSHQTNFSSLNDVTVEYVENINSSGEWDFDDPVYSTRLDSLYLSKWDSGNVFVLNRGLRSNNYIALKLVEKTTEHYIFDYKSVTEPGFAGTKTIAKNDNYSYIYFSFKTEEEVEVEPAKDDWDFVVGPYFGWYETNTPGEFTPYRQSGFLINNEAGIEVARIFDEDILFLDIDESFIETAKFIDFKGAIGSNWKLLGKVDSPDLYSMDPNKKYIMKTFDNTNSVANYYKMQITYYKNTKGDYHFPTVEYALIGSR